MSPVVNPRRGLRVNSFEIDAAIDGVKLELRKQQRLVSRLARPETNRPLLQLMWFGLGQLKWLEGQRRLSEKREA